jgi:HSP20 family molecular chaperone IbpA
MYNFVPQKFQKLPVSSATYGDESLWDSLRKNFDEMFMDVTYYNEDGNLVYKVEVPGFNKDNLSINIQNDILIIKGKRELKDKERHVGNKSINKKLSIVDRFSDIDAEIKDGILTVTLMKTEVEIQKIELK